MNVLCNLSYYYVQSPRFSYHNCNGWVWARPQVVTHGGRVGAAVKRNGAAVEWVGTAVERDGVAVERNGAVVKRNRRDEDTDKDRGQGYGQGETTRTQDKDRGQGQRTRTRQQRGQGHGQGQRTGTWRQRKQVVAYGSMAGSSPRYIQELGQRLHVQYPRANTNTSKYRHEQTPTRVNTDMSQPPLPHSGTSVPSSRHLAFPHSGTT